MLAMTKRRAAYCQPPSEMVVISPVATTPMIMAEESNRLIHTMRNAERRRSGGLELWADAGRAMANADLRAGVGAAGARSDTNSLLAGLGYTRGDLSISVGGGVSESDVNVERRGSKAEIGSTIIGADTSYRPGGFELSGGISHSWHDIDTRRTVVFPGFADDVESSRDARVTQVEISAALPMAVGGIGVAPFIEVGRQWVHLDATREQGGEAALAIDSERFKTTRTLAGGRLNYSFAGLGGVVTSRLSAGWEHLMGGREGQMTAALPDGDRFSIDGIVRASNAARLRAGMDADFGAFRIGLSYDGRLASSEDRHSVSLNLGVRF